MKIKYLYIFFISVIAIGEVSSQFGDKLQTL